MDYFRRLRDAAIGVALLVIPFFFLKSNLANPDNAGPLDRLIVQISSPIQYVATQTAQAVSGVLEEYVYLVDVKRDNDRLRIDTDRLNEENRMLRIQAQENRRLRDLLQLRERLGGEVLSAQVISRDISSFFRVIRIRLDRGERDSVRHGMPVVSAQGLVGQIHGDDGVGRHASVLLTVDRDSHIDVIVQRTGARGILRGTGENDRYACRVQFLKRTDEVEAGDELYTSGYGRRFPASILVGRVTEVRSQDFGLYQEVVAEPSVNFSSLDEVLILKMGSREQNALRGRRGFDEPSAEGNE